MTNPIKTRSQWLPVFDAPWLNREACDAAFAEMDQRSDRLGDRLHLIFAALGAAVAMGPTTATEFAFVPLLVMSGLRVFKTFPTWRYAVLQPAMIGVLLLMLWQAVGLLWSAELDEGIEAINGSRWFLVGALAWPVIRDRRWIVYGVIAGALAANLAQILHAIGNAADLDWLTFDRLASRNSAWWDPVVGGTMLTAVLGLHLPAAMMGRGQTRTIAIVLAAITLVGVLATGSRGAWLASFGLIGLVAIVAFVRSFRASTIDWKKLAIVGVLAIVAAGAGWIAVGDTITSRFTSAQEDLSRALSEEDFDSDTGMRLVMMRLAWDEFLAHPVQGIGPGSYQHALADHLDGAGYGRRRAVGHGHAHNALLHSLATGGIIGAGLLVFVIVAALRGGFANLAPGAIGTYAAGPAFAILGLVLAGAFDTIQLNQQPAMLLGLLVALCPSCMPSKPNGVG